MNPSSTEPKVADPSADRVRTILLLVTAVLILAPLVAYVMTLKGTGPSK